MHSVWSAASVFRFAAHFGIIRRVRARVTIFCFALWGILSAPSLADGLCPAQPDIPDDAGPTLHMEAVRAQGQLDRSVEMSGDVVLSQGRRRIHAEQVFFNKEASTVRLSSPFLYDDPLLRLNGRNGIIDVHQRKGSFADVEYLIRANGGRGRAAEIWHDGEQSELREVSYSTCPADNPVWNLSADSLRLHHQRGQGIAEKAWLRLYRVPVFYVPVFPFPLGTKRQSGFLPPSLRTAGYTGFDVSVPYYLNIAPDRDATLLVRGMTKQGLALGGEYRYLADSGAGEIYAEINPQAGGGERDRGYLRTRLRHVSGPWTAAAAVDHVSDRDYFEDYGGGSRYSSLLRQRVRLSSRFAGARLAVGVNGYQVLQSGLHAEQEPYEQLPFAHLRYRRVLGASGIDISLRSEWTRFERDAGARGWRLHMQPALGANWRHRGFWVRPRLAADVLTYGIDQAAESHPGRLVPTWTMDAGLLFAGGRSFFNRQWNYTLTPRLTHRYVPYKNQDDSPLFDTAAPARTHSSLFYHNRYTGPDRIGDEHSITLSLETDFWRWSADETIRFVTGRKLYLRDRRLVVPGDLSPTAGHSPLFQKLIVRLGDWYLSGRWDPGGGRTRDNYGLRARYGSPDGRYWELWHRSILADARSPRTLLRYNVPWNRRLRLHGHIDYVWPTSSLYDMTVGIDMRFCCWRMTVGIRRRGSEENRNYVNELFMQINLSGLSPEPK